MELLLGMLLGCTFYTLLCTWLAHKVKQEIRGERKSLPKRKLTQSKQLDVQR